MFLLIHPIRLNNPQPIQNAQRRDLSPAGTLKQTILTAAR
jgi:hypothetical protein